MKSLDDLPHIWFSAGGNEKLWGDQGTYMPVERAKLPPLPVDGSFRWLLPPSKGMFLMGFENEQQPKATLAKRAQEATALGLTVPTELVRFLTDRELYARIPSCTACYFDIGDRLVEIPGYSGPARLLRFMNDQQTCLLWYVLLEPGARHRVVVASPGWPDDDVKSESLDDAMVPEDIAICADSFEEHMKRFWIENTLWWATHEGHPAIEGELKAYLDDAKSRR